MQGMVMRARANPDPYSAEAQIVMEEMIRQNLAIEGLTRQARESKGESGNGI